MLTSVSALSAGVVGQGCGVLEERACFSQQNLNSPPVILPLASVPQLPPLFREDPSGCDRDGCPVSQGKLTPGSSLVPPSTTTTTTQLKDLFEEKTAHSKPTGLSTGNQITLFCVKLSRPTTVSVYLGVLSRQTFNCQTSHLSPHRGRPRRPCEGLCVSSPPARADFTGSARRRRSTAPARQTSS